MSILVLQSSWWGRESWLLCLICLPGVSWWLSGSSSLCHGVVCSLWLWYFLIILIYYLCGMWLWHFLVIHSFRWTEKQFQNSSLFLPRSYLLCLMATSHSSRQACPETNAFWCIHRDHFAIPKIEKAFCLFAIDQPHKQNIAVIKGNRGVIGLTEDKYKAFFLSLSANIS